MTNGLIVIQPANDCAVFVRGNMTEQEYNDEVLGIVPHLDAPEINSGVSNEPTATKPF